MPHTTGREIASAMKKMTDVRSFLDRMRGEFLVDRSLRKYLQDSTFEIGTNQHGQIVMVLEFAPTIQPSGDGYNSLRHLINKLRGHSNPVIRKGHGKHHVVYEDDTSFEIRLTYTGMIEGEDGDDSIENKTGGETS